MNVQDVFKFQAMSNMGKPGISIYDVIFQVLMMIFIGIMDDLAKLIPSAVQFVQERASSRMRTAITSAVSPCGGAGEALCANAILLDKRHDINSITMMRIYKPDSSGGGGSSGDSGRSSSSATDPTEMNLIVDAILAYVSRLDNIPTFCLIPNGNFMVSYRDKPVQITKDIYMKIDEIITDPKSGNVATIRVTLSSNTLSASDITNFVQTVYTSHQEEMKNSLGKNIYFFDQKTKDPPPPPFGMDTQNKRELMNHRRMVVQTAPKQLAFTMSPFYSNKRFGNIFGTDVRKVQRRVDFFANNREWYDEKGIPYQLGIMLSGLPGTGKTSLIRAIANLTKRHIVNVNFSTITTASQLKNLFYNDKIVVYTDTSLGDTKSYYIPIEQRLYVLEEIDAVGNILKQRSATSATGATGADASDPNETIPDELTLGDILTVLDGTMEVPGRMIIMTSNHPEVLDRALLRPGRIDINVRFGNATRDLIAEMYEAYLEAPFPAKRISDLPNDVLTPAEVSEIIMKYCKTEFDPDQVVDDICRSCPSWEENENVATSVSEEQTSLVEQENVATSVSEDQKQTVGNEEQLFVAYRNESRENPARFFPKTTKNVSGLNWASLKNYADLLEKNNCYNVKLDDVLNNFISSNDSEVVDQFFNELMTIIGAINRLTIYDTLKATIHYIVRVFSLKMLKGITYPIVQLGEEALFDHIIPCIDTLQNLSAIRNDITDITISDALTREKCNYMRDILNVIKNQFDSRLSKDDFFKDNALQPYDDTNAFGGYALLE